mmetsp:Transcript_30358/g.69970  ORF Transcript_30358/g.69970 Transcript_30358/m.69970 type:complete len:244 (+) Transcript_30358:27-758(+)
MLKLHPLLHRGGGDLLWFACQMIASRGQRKVGEKVSQVENIDFIVVLWLPRGTIHFEWRTYFILFFHQDYTFRIFFTVQRLLSSLLSLLFSILFGCIPMFHNDRYIRHKVLEAHSWFGMRTWSIILFPFFGGKCTPMSDRKKEHFQTNQYVLNRSTCRCGIIIIVIILGVVGMNMNKNTNQETLPKGHKHDTLDAQKFRKRLTPLQFFLHGMIEFQQTGKCHPDRTGLNNGQQKGQRCKECQR